jgi:hypothetical protein
MPILELQRALHDLSWRRHDNLKSETDDLEIRVVTVRLLVKILFYIFRSDVIQLPLQTRPAQ